MFKILNELVIYGLEGIVSHTVFHLNKMLEMFQDSLITCNRRWCHTIAYPLTALVDVAIKQSCNGSL